MCRQAHQAVCQCLEIWGIKLQMRKKKIITKSEKETFKLGEKMVQEIKKPVVLGLVGDLGAGKTQFVKGLAKGLGIKNSITSPTFVVLRKYELKGKTENFVHIDCYRLTNPEELLDLGLDECIKEGKSIIAIEWADKVKDILPKDTVWIDFKQGEGNERIINI